MKPLVVSSLVFLAVTLSACSSSNTTADLVPPQLIYQHPLPAYPRPIVAFALRIPLEIFVSDKGEVQHVHVRSGSGDAQWDSAAATSIMLWRYEPGRSGDQPVGLWLRQTAVVQFSEPHYLPLAEIICSDHDQADSVYRLLINGAPFSETAVQFSDADSRSAGGRIGVVNIQLYPDAVKRKLSRLGKNEFTAPIAYGNRYAIFLRLSE
jgi:hypothetical protein